MDGTDTEPVSDVAKHYTTREEKGKTEADTWFGE